MKRYRFRLESVLRVRRLQEDVARAALAEAAVAVAAAQVAQARAGEWLDGLRAGPAPDNAPAWEASRTVQLAAAEELAARRVDLEAARVEQRSRQAVLAEARTRVRALERLDERRRTEHALEAARQDERAVDDLVTSRHQRRPE